MIKACFFDVDGTLVSHTQGAVPQKTKKSLEQLRKKGIKIFLSTGRHLEELDRLPVKGMVFDGYVTLNGQLCANEEKEILHRAPLPEEDARALIEIFQKKEEPLMLIEENRLYVNFINDTVCQAEKEVSTPLPPVSVYTGAPVYMAIAFIRKEEEERFMPLIPSGCKMTRWASGGVDIISRNGGKVAGIQKVLEHYGIRREEIIAFGDGENDMDMLQFAGIGVAMGNAGPEVKEAADYVTKHIDEDGLEKALRHYGLLE
ncbi:MAG: Cof-type HAD-IIB family hydrolase [Lachnospiraceae bacterium]|nr:Cof-type HAD-IIB family hydrolase [Lachnospiraceae bacterium]MDY3223731.1 Cof-type HAD-IIB family hydrolase [Lachnospiraceae bacterium]